MTDPRMTPTNDAPVTVEPAFLLMKRGLFYRPGNAGYTGIKADAGRYEQSEADELSGVTAIHENDAPMFAPACWDDVKVKHLLGIIAERDNALAALASAPAGDGDAAALKFALAVKAELVERAPTYSIQSVEREHFDRAILAISALARPRAAVGEREA